ncbi:hypothetical protein BaRGS_00033451 [Batillaria attramentaria]|uniref:Uncharacterized protein n=1 Tax=Batillaria attramentaria TaxID=370345 RepID=A0ABD0JKA7_9CAEN
MKFERAAAFVRHTNTFMALLKQKYAHDQELMQWCVLTKLHRPCNPHLGLTARGTPQKLNMTTAPHPAFIPTSSVPSAASPGQNKNKKLTESEVECKLRNSMNPTRQDKQVALR